MTTSPLGWRVGQERCWAAVSRSSRPSHCSKVELIKHRTHIGSAREAFSALHVRLGLELARTPLADVVDQALAIGWTREPMDRLIVANAMAEDAQLLTADTRIRSNFVGALW